MSRQWKHAKTRNIFWLKPDYVSFSYPLKICVLLIAFFKLLLNVVGRIGYSTYILFLSCKSWDYFFELIMSYLFIFIKLYAAKAGLCFSYLIRDLKVAAMKTCRNEKYFLAKAGLCFSYLIRDLKVAAMQTCQNEKYFLAKAEQCSSFFSTTYSHIH